MASQSFHLLFPVTFTIAVLLVCGQGGADFHIHSTRLKLMKDALDWMTFRKDGKLVSATEREQIFLPHLTDGYTRSKYYRTFVIAFLEGVVPKLTLQENDPCDSTYTLKYKNAWNSSVTYGYQMMFNLNSFEEGNTSGVQFCDYRQGLICNPSTKKCECPVGSSMQPIESGSSVRRCLLDENEICVLIDLAHGSDPNQVELARNMLHLAFNLEKPLSCKSGTQCRFKPTDLVSPRCYDVNAGPWAPPFTDAAGNSLSNLEINYGDECTLGLYASSGMCVEPDDVISATRRYTCYNYGPPRSLGSTNSQNKTGFCGPDVGRHGIGPFNWPFNYSVQYGSIPDYFPIFSPYVHPRTVPLRGKELEDFMNKFLKQARKLIYDDVQAYVKGSPCSINKTKEYEDTWSYFSSLEDDPPPGQDYVPAATKPQLDANLQKFVDLTDDPSRPGRVCKVYYLIHHYGSPVASHITSFKCIPALADGSGNDGICEEPGTLNTLQYANTFFQIQSDQVKLSHYLYYRKYPIDWTHLDILRHFADFPETQCTAQNLTCPLDYVCYEDYSDFRRFYTLYTYPWNPYCDFNVNPPPLEHFCHESRADLEYGDCEDKQLNKIGLQEIEDLLSYSTIGMGGSCQHDLEKRVRQWLDSSRGTYYHEKFNKYKVLVMLRELRKAGGFDEGLFCDRSKLLECSEAGVCECLKWKKNTQYPPTFQTRSVKVEGTMYKSDYCYQASGYLCVKMEEFNAFTKAEMDKFRMHYGEPDALCKGGNLCVYLSLTPGIACTTENSGKTGYEDVEPTTTTETSKGSLRPGRASETLGHTLLMAGFSVFLLRRRFRST